MEVSKALREKLATACRRLYREGLMDRAALIGTPAAMEHGALEDARRQVWNPKVIAKVRTCCELKAQVQVLLEGKREKGKRRPARNARSVEPQRSGRPSHESRFIRQ